MNHKRAIVTAVFVAPTAPALLFFLTMPAAAGMSWLAAVGNLPGWYSFAFGCTVVAGLPAFLLLRRKDMLRWGPMLMAGFAAGALIPALIQVLGYVDPWVIAYGGGAGCADACLFFTVYRRGRAERLVRT